MKTAVSWSAAAPRYMISGSLRLGDEAETLNA